MQQVTFQEVWDTFVGYGPVVWIGVLSYIITFIFEMVLYEKRIIFSSRRNKLERAIRLGHVIEAKQVSCMYDELSDDNDRLERVYTCYYEYYVDGVLKKKRITTGSSAGPETLEIYYVDTPAKVFTEYDVGSRRLEVLVFIIPIFVAYFVMKLLGYQP